MAPFDARSPFTTSTARRAGITRWRLEGPAFQRVLTGVYVAAEVTLSVRVRAIAALLLAPAGAVASHHTAAALLGGVVPHTSEVHVGIPADRRLRVAGVRAHRHPHPPPSTTRHGVPVTTAEATFLDLAAVLDLVDLVVLGDSLVRAGVASPDTLVSAARTHRGRGARLARRAAGLVRVGAESPMETRLRLLVVLAGLPEPVLQHVVVSRAGTRRLDLAWPAVRVALEYDGRHHIEREGQWRGDLVRREELEGEGWRFVVAVAADVYATPDATLRRVEAALRRAGLRARAASNEWRRHFPSREAA